MYKNASDNAQYAARRHVLDVQNGVARELSPREQLAALKDASTRLNEMARVKDYSVYGKAALGQKIQETNLEILRVRALVPKRTCSIEEFTVYFLRQACPKHLARRAYLQANAAYKKFDGDFDAFQRDESLSNRGSTVAEVA